ncbi:hypothetical protein [Mesomycoplasma ovipneumoniae]|uniref:hypothetical protein n=1 Tax=Mesomycoplasma ovipneumoniae TaxID=29562 RepID=UPI00083E7583|nr:hypothetical protein [Mesomycoplasma ovipneumoniae]
MRKIIDLEIKNLSQKEKEELLYDLSAETRDWYDENTRGIRWNPNYKTFEEYVGDDYFYGMYEEDLLATKEEYLDDDVSLKYFFKSYLPIKNSKVWYYWGNEVDELLKDYFEEFPDDFVKFQKTNKNSLYNQTLKEHDFKDLGYKDTVINLTQKQKDEIIDDVKGLAKYWKYRCEENCGSYYDADGFNYYYDYNPTYIENIDEEDRANVKKHEYSKNSKYVLVTTFSNKKDRSLVFFENDNDLIEYALNMSVSAVALLHDYNEILNPHHKVNEWIVTNHKLELAQKDGLEQAQKFEVPKLKI